MATAFFAPISRHSPFLAPLLVRPPNLFIRLISNAPRLVSCSTASELLRAGYTYLDVRTPDEFKAGHPSGAMNIPYMLQTKAGMLKNSRFEQEVSSSFKKDDQIIVGCRSGKRSLIAATDLANLGFTRIVDLAGGYVAWTQNGQPVSKED